MSRPLRALLALVSTLALAVAPIASPGSAVAAPGDLPNVGTWNLQGAGHSTENKWQTGVGSLMREYRLLALQEAGSPPESAVEQQVVTTPDGTGREWRVHEFRWLGTESRPNSYVYWLETDPNGHRVNLAIITRERVDAIDVVAGPYRPALGVRQRGAWYFSAHGASGSGGDVPTLLNNINQRVGAHRQADHADYRWYALGDFNRDLRNGGIPFVVNPTAGPTHPATAPTSHYDYMVRDNGVELQGTVLAVQLSDHLAVRYTFPPDDQPDPTPTQSLRVMPLGDSITEGVGSSNHTGYRSELYDQLRGDVTTLDFVGSLSSGAMSDPQHEGHSGWMIDQITAAADLSVATLRPNVVTLHAGTNDMDRGDAIAAPGRINHLINRVLADSPGVVVLVATLVPSTSPTVQARIDSFNQTLHEVVAGHQADGHHVGLVDMRGVTTADLDDTLHPNDSGYHKMADAFHHAIIGAVQDGWITPGGAVPPSCPTPGGSWLPRGQIASGTGFATGPSVRFADLDGDGRDDYLVLHPGGAVDAWRNNGGDHDGQAGWAPIGRVAGGTGSGPSDTVTFADLDGDHRDDYLVIGTQGQINAWRNNGGDQNGPQGWIALGQIATGVPEVVTSRQIELADVDGDERDDYLVVSQTNAVDAWLNNGGDHDGHAGWIPRGRIASGVGTSSDTVVFADLTCDRLADYALLGHGGRIDAWRNIGGDRDGQAGFIPMGRIATGTSAPGAVHLADFNGDGLDDYLVVDQNGVVNAWQNNGGDPA
ncbi:FG-GAP-like repeat-containing protein [Actinokineospora spheciospongiae]|uniref:FG-GAP-like repeat-containing protein n=1 Tax=Actinokineospora spheciospongiae TaxID=909613 RepID=UPI0013769963|nr:GDSL-type esterase/lipase family protein [Actinokineospora spheciospongiae]